MITSINDKNRNRYAELFAEATEVLHAKNAFTDDNAYKQVEVTPDSYYPGGYYIKQGTQYTLDDSPSFNGTKTYYTLNAISTLNDYFSHIGTLYSGTNYKYIMLPLDEEPFEINANARTITVPDNFKRYGIAVQGDNAAEMLFFRVDRYFDAQDLANVDIYVLWEGKDVALSTSIRAIDVESEPGKIIFGCPVTNNVTQMAGSLKLSVRFYLSDGYCLNTLPISVTINSSINKDHNAEMQQDTSFNDVFGLIIKDSQVSGIEPIPAKAKFLTLADNDLNVVLTDNDSNGIYTATRRLTTYVSDLTQDGSLIYNWYYKETPDSKRVRLGGNAKEGVTVKEVYNKTTDSIFNPEKNYYTKLAAPATGYQVALLDDAFETGVDYYERYTTIEFSGAIGIEPAITGSYFAIATNSPSRRSENSQSDSFVLEPPIDPIVTTSLNNITNTLVNGKFALTFTDNSAEDNDAEFSYKYYYRAPGASDFNEYTKNEGHNVKDPGHYYIEVSSVKNLVEKTANSMGDDANNPAYIKVVGDPEAPILKEYNYIDNTPPTVVAVGDTLTVELADDFAINEFTSDEIIYEWVFPDAGDADKDGDTGEEVVYATGNSLKIINTTPTAILFHCNVINKLNNKTAVSKTCNFVIGG